MREYIYVWVEVGPVNPKAITGINNLMESQLGIILPDVIPHTSPDRIKFNHVIVEAENEDKAYLYGGRAVCRTPGTVFNDYVVPLNNQSPIT